MIMDFVLDQQNQNSNMTFSTSNSENNKNLGTENSRKDV